MELVRVNEVQLEWIADLSKELELHARWIEDEKHKKVFYRNELDLWMLEKVITDTRKFKNKKQGLERLIERCERNIEYYEKSMVKTRIKLYILRGDPK